MKKLACLLTALVMMLVAVPVLAEETAAKDITGTWYLTMLKMTMGTMEMNADGTCSLSMTMGDETKEVEGTWTGEGDQIAITIKDQSMPLTVIEENGSQKLKINEAGLKMIGVADGDMPPEVIDKILAFTREKGVISFAEFEAYQSNGALPEGKTKAEMDAIMMELQLTMLQLLGDVAGKVPDDEVPVTPLDGPITGGPVDENAPEIKILEDNYYIRASYSGQEAIYICKVQNPNDKPVYITDAVMTLSDKDGKEIAKTEYMNARGSRYMEPGEISYFSIAAGIEGEVNTEEIKQDAKLLAEWASYQDPDKNIAVESAELRTEAAYDGEDYYVAARIKNETEAPMAGINAVVLVRDSNGKMIDLVEDGIYRHELEAGSTITLISGMDSSTEDYCKANDTKPESVEAIAWVEEH